MAVKGKILDMAHLIHYALSNCMKLVFLVSNIDGDLVTLDLVSGSIIRYDIESIPAWAQRWSNGH